MAYFIALGILSLAGVVGTVWLVRTDGYGRIPTDPSRVTSSPLHTTRATRSRESAVHAAPGAEAARPTLHVTLPSASSATSPLRIVGTE